MEFKLVCSVCGRPYDGPTDYYACPECGASIEVEYDLESNKEKLQQVIRDGSENGIWGYRDLLPVAPDVPEVSLDEGGTPLLNAKNLAKWVGIDNLYLKNETLNPTGTYKDRFATVAITQAASDGTPAVALGSAGNAAAAIAGFCARAAIPCYVLLPPGAVRERGYQVMSYGARFIKMPDTIDDCIRMAQRGEEIFGWKNVNTAMRYHPYGAEGYKTIAYEICRQLDFKMPDWIFCPVGGGSLMSKIWKGFKDVKALGLIDRLPRFVGVQAEGCMPFVEAYKKGMKDADVWSTPPDTIAFAIADICAFEAITALTAVRTTGGSAEAVNDTEILTAVRQIAKLEGVLAEPASSATVAVLKNLVDEGIVKKEDTVVCVLSGSALRDLALIVDGMPGAFEARRNNTDDIRDAIKYYDEINQTK